MSEHDSVVNPSGSLRAVLEHAWDASAFTTTEAMDGAALTRSTTIEALDRLVDLGLLAELQNAREAGQYRLGRPSRRFSFRPDAGAVIGVDAGQQRLTAAVADLRGAVQMRRSVESVAGENDPHSRRREIRDLVDSALDDAGLGHRDVLAVCVGVPAAVGPTGTSPAHRLGYWQAMNPSLQDLFEEWAPLVRIENDASLAAVAEGRLGAAAGARDFVALLAGQRFGIGAVVDGKLLYGAHGAAGESIALRLITGVESDAGLAALISQWARSDALAHRLSPGHPSAQLPLEELTSQAVLDLATSGDEW
ncbi:MAG TPA: ROK family protein, partial [Brevibacterium sp.]|nr:ROK family protein [Brevibacterium sp.]